MKFKFMYREPYKLQIGEVQVIVKKGDVVELNEAESSFLGAFITSGDLIRVDDENKAEQQAGEIVLEKNVSEKKARKSKKKGK